MSCVVDQGPPQHNQWPLVRRTPVLPKYSRVAGVTVTILHDQTDSERVWTFRPAHHTFLVYLGESIERLEAQIDDGPLVVEPPMAGSVSSVPAGSRYHARLVGQAPYICEICVQGTAPNGQTRFIAPLMNVRDGLLHQSSLRFAELAGAQGEAARLLLDCLSAAVYWHIVETYCQAPAVAKAQYDHPLSAKAKTLLELYIRDHLAERITLDELAEIGSLSTHNLLKRFRASFGTTPAQYIINERVAQAQLLLQQSSLPITEVALATGFYSPSHFSTVFSKLVGITPTAYRRKF